MPNNICTSSDDQLATTLAHGLTRDGRKGWHRAHDILAQIVAGELVDALDARD